jgi:hypothetical protein
MLQLADARTGRKLPVGAAGSRRLTVAYCPGSLRAAVTADLVRRAVERHRVAVMIAPHPCGEPPVPDLLRYNVHPPTAPSAVGPVDVHVGPHDHETGDRTVLAVMHDHPAPPGADPLAVRLALMARPYADRAPVTPADLADAHTRLLELRSDVARFAESPSGAIPLDRISAIHAAVDDGLDTPLALALTDALRHDGAVSPGARFESLVHLDRTFGLDLAQDIGRIHPAD